MLVNASVISFKVNMPIPMPFVLLTFTGGWTCYHEVLYLIFKCPSQMIIFTTKNVLHLGYFLKIVKFEKCVIQLWEVKLCIRIQFENEL